MKALMLGAVLIGVTVGIAQGQDTNVTAADRVQYAIESKILYVQDAVRPEYADRSTPEAFGSSFQGAWVAPRGEPVFASEPKPAASPDATPDTVSFPWMDSREDVELISAPRITLHGWRPGEVGFGNGTLFKVIMNTGEQVQGGTGGIGGGGADGAFSNVYYNFFASFPTPLDPRFYYGRGIIADIGSRTVPCVDRRQPSDGQPGSVAEIVESEIEIDTGIVIAPRVVEGDGEKIHLDYVLNYRSTSTVPKDERLTRDEIYSRLLRANVGMDLMFEDGETQRIVVPLGNGDFLDVYVTVDKIANTGTKRFEAN